MSILEVFLIGVGLSMDAFAVSICKGLCMNKINKKQALIIGLFFGGFQAMMPTLGYFLASFFAKYVVAYSHWVAFLLLLFIGGNMIREAVTGDEDEDGEKEMDSPLRMGEMTVLAIATSIDALAVGVTFAFMEMKYRELAFSVGLIGCTTFVISIIGVVIGNIFGNKYEKKAEIAGGVILILIGLKILLEGLGIL